MMDRNTKRGIDAMISNLVEFDYKYYNSSINLLDFLIFTIINYQLSKYLLRE